MEFVQSGLPLSFEVTFDSPTLFVAMKVYDNSGGSPSLLTTLPMSNFYGNSYQAKYTPAGAKSYLIHKAVYTDGTYATLDTNYAAGTEAFRADDIAGIVLNAMLSSYQIPGSVGAAIGIASASAPSPSNIEAVVDLLPEIEG